LLAGIFAAAGDNEAGAFLCERDGGLAADARQRACDQDYGGAHGQSFHVWPTEAGQREGKF